MSSKATETMINLSFDTRDELKARKRGGEPYDAVLSRLLEQTEEN